MTSEAPQGSLIFVIHINELGTSVGGLISKFADYAKMLGLWIVRKAIEVYSRI